ncbi:MAG: Unknown protein [uncultured Aureispira sp.]|uniref:ATPase AAA-type core domain-containing protein n=1 Tax=uncultured Aureispira sp. TaxID=1331704 RepID=A0A6S6SSX7_9BACT|nr:MAG: Unknown protein [uncultured Aureispira sp.]
MGKLRVQNFGPITQGLVGKEKFLDIKKVTLLIGNQATGKSSVAKLYSTFSWLEKALTRGILKENDIVLHNRFAKKHCAYQGLENYFKDHTVLEYIGNSYHFLYQNETTTLKKINADKRYLSPKIMYVPAERNFLSVVEHPQQLKFLPLPLYTFLDEFERSKMELKSSVQLPINNIKFEYQRQHKISYIKGTDFKLKLVEASSGIQSLLPVFLVSRNLAYSLIEKRDSNTKESNIEEQRKKDQKINALLNQTDLSDELRQELLEILLSNYKSLRLINIVEELEQNLFPESQRNLLNKLLEFNNLTKENELLITTHSPYLLNYLTLAIKGGEIKKTLLKKGLEQSDQLQKVVPINSCVFSEDVNIYQLTDNGEIKLLPTYEGLPSDENFLNNSLAETNELFDDLLELEEELDD